MEDGESEESKKRRGDEDATSSLIYLFSQSLYLDMGDISESYSWHNPARVDNSQGTMSHRSLHLLERNARQCLRLRDGRPFKRRVKEDTVVLDQSDVLP
jgi:hypothetical protein